MILARAPRVRSQPPGTPERVRRTTAPAAGSRDGRPESRRRRRPPPRRRAPPRQAGQAKAADRSRRRVQRGAGAGGEGLRLHVPHDPILGAFLTVRAVEGDGWRSEDPEALQQRSEEHTSELQSPCNLVCRLLLEKKKNNINDRCIVPPSSVDS